MAAKEAPAHTEATQASIAGQLVWREPICSAAAAPENECCGIAGPIVMSEDREAEASLSCGFL